MFWLALLATVAQADVPRPSALPLRQAKASVRIVRASPVRFQEIEQRAPATLRKTLIRSPDGELHEARLLEFE